MIRSAHDTWICIETKRDNLYYYSVVWISRSCIKKLPTPGFILGIVNGLIDRFVAFNKMVSIYILSMEELLEKLGFVEDIKHDIRLVYEELLSD